jgi:prepilin-type N-terminal cleavage/methylation domain-containing protein
MMPTRPRARPERGFTLIEILAVIVITGFVMYAIYAVLFSTLAAQEEVERTVAVYEVGPRILDLVVRDLNNVAYGLLADDNGLKGGVEAVGGVDASYVDLVTSQDSRTVLIMHEQEYHSDFTEIGYRLKPSDANPELLELYRREDWGVDDQPLAEGLFHKVYDRVKEFKLEYIEHGKEDAEEYPDAWDTSAKKRLPRAVRITLTIVIGDADELAARDETGEYTFIRVLVFPGGDDVHPEEQPNQPGR